MANKKSKATKAAQAPMTTASVRQGKNAPVNNVIKFEDIVQHLKQVSSPAARVQAGAKSAAPSELDTIKQLATELEKHLRTVRKSAPDKPATALAKRRKLNS